MLLLIPFPLLISIIAATVIHEFFHILMMQLLQVPVFEIEMSIHSINIRTIPLEVGREILCAFAGPLGSFICIIFFRQFPLFALCGFIQGCYNLLPIYPMDGGRIWSGLVKMMFDIDTTHFFKKFEIAFLCFVILCLLIAYHYTNKSVFFLCALYFIARIVRFRKIPCKEAQY